MRTLLRSGVHSSSTLRLLSSGGSWRRVEYTANSNTRNRIPGANGTENAVSCIGFRGVGFLREVLSAERAFVLDGARADLGDVDCAGALAGGRGGATLNHGVKVKGGEGGKEKEREEGRRMAGASAQQGQELNF
eukprot:520849-Rhodomonas_salina.1